MASKNSEFINKMKHEPSENDNVIEMETDIILEDGEISDDNEENIAPLAEVESTLFDNPSEERPGENAKRFALIGDMTLAVPKNELKELYDSLGIDEETERHYRFNTVHIRNAHGMKTKDILEYLSGLEPVSVYWLEDGICNVQWDDEILPARTLLYLSVEIKNMHKNIKVDLDCGSGSSDEEEITGNSVDAFKLKFMLPPGKWRKGASCPMSKDIIMRYANKDDKVFSKTRDRYARGSYSRHGKKSKHHEIHVDTASKNPWGSIAQSWGRGEGLEKHIWPTAPPRNIPDLRDSLNDVIESRFTDFYLQRATEVKRERPPSPPVFDSSNSSSEFEDDVVRRRKLPQMHADREEKKIKMARLEATVRAGDLRSRLNQKKMRKTAISQLPQSSNRSDDSSEELSSGWAAEGYEEIKKTLVIKSEFSREDSLASDSDGFGIDEPGELLQIQVDNEYYSERRRRRKH